MKNKNDIKIIISSIDNFLKEDNELCKYEIECILKKRLSKKVYFAFAFDYEENLIIITYNNGQITTTEKLHISSIGDGLLFNILEKVFVKIEYISFFMHYELWKEIDTKFLSIENWRGMNKYLQYCVDNYIDKEKIDREITQNITPDIIKYYEHESILDKITNFLEERRQRINGNQN